MIEIKINIDTANDAFSDASELDRILTRIKGDLIYYDQINKNAAYKLKDINGNTVGNVSFNKKGVKNDK